MTKEWTGLTDKNDNRIFVGDTIEGGLDTDSIVSLVRYEGVVEKIVTYAVRGQDISELRFLKKLRDGEEG